MEINPFSRYRSQPRGSSRSPPRSGTPAARSPSGTRAARARAAPACGAPPLAPLSRRTSSSTRPPLQFPTWLPVKAARPSLCSCRRVTSTLSSRASVPPPATSTRPLSLSRPSTFLPRPATPCDPAPKPVAGYRALFPRPTWFFQQPNPLPSFPQCQWGAPASRARGRSTRSSA